MFRDPLQVLIADPDPAIRLLVSAILRSIDQDVRLETSNDSLSALQTLQRRPGFNVIVAGFLDEQQAPAFRDLCGQLVPGTPVLLLTPHPPATDLPPLLPRDFDIRECRHLLSKLLLKGE